MAKQAPSGSLADAAFVRSTVSRLMKASRKSRAQIAEEMTALCGATVTERMLNSYAADSREDHRFPLEYLRAFCEAIGDWSLLREVCELAGFKCADDSAQHAMAVGQAFIDKLRAQAEVDKNERILQGVSL